MTEIEAAIGIEQLKKMEHLIGERVKSAELLSEALKGLKGLRLPIIKKYCTHVFYVYPMVLDEKVVGASRDTIAEALRAEGVVIAQRYCNLHLLPMFQKKQAYGKRGFPWTGGIYKGSVSYEKGICPIAENLQDNRFLGIGMCVHKYTERDIDLIAKAFHKVWRNLDKLS